jgi:hypothetical protein
MSSSKLLEINNTLRVAKPLLSLEWSSHALSSFFFFFDLEVPYSPSNTSTHFLFVYFQFLVFIFFCLFNLYECFCLIKIIEGICMCTFLGVMLKVIFVSISYPSKNNMTLKIIISLLIYRF